MFCLSECSLVFLPGDEQQPCKFLPWTSREVSQLITGFFFSRPVILGKGGRREMTCCTSPVIYCCRKNSGTLGLRNSHFPHPSILCSVLTNEKFLLSVFSLSLLCFMMVLIGEKRSKFQKCCTAVTVNCVSELGFGSGWGHWASPVGKELLVEILCVCGVWDWVFSIHFLVKSWMVFTTLTVLDVN